MGCHRSCCYGPKAAVIAASVGAFFCVGFSLTFYFFPLMFHSIVLNVMVLAPDGLMYDGFVNVPIDLIANIYFFNYTNHDTFMENWKYGEKPKVDQVGPYVYTVHLKKVFMDWSNESYVSFRQLHYYTFHPELSSGSEDDIIITPNVVAFGIPDSGISKPLSKILEKLYNEYPDAEPPFINVSVGDYVWYSYKDEALAKTQEKLHTEIFPEGRIGIMYGMNGSDDKKYQMATGSANPNDMYLVTEWNGMSSLESIWDDPYCGMFNGSDGSLFPPPGLDRFDRIYYFISSFFRTFSADYTEDVTYKGIKCYNYRTPASFFGDYRVNPDNFCYTDGDGNLSYASGVLYFGKLAFGLPIYLSNPHFLDGDFKLVDDIDGLSPNEEEHSTQWAVMPELGAPVQGNMRLQANILVRPNPWINTTWDWPTVMLPIVWGNTSASLTDEMAAKVVKYYYGFIKFIYGLIIAFIIIAGLISLAGIGCSYKLMFQFKQAVVTKDNDEFVFEDENPKNDRKHSSQSKSDETLHE
ncbi:scavenger receptor class B, member [Chamberlinius hualienensis]